MMPPFSVPINVTLVGLIFTTFTLQFVFTFNNPEIFSLLSSSNGMRLPSSVKSTNETVTGYEVELPIVCISIPFQLVVWGLGAFVC